MSSKLHEPAIPYKKALAALISRPRSKDDDENALLQTCQSALEDCLELGLTGE